MGGPPPGAVESHAQAMRTIARGGAINLFGSIANAGLALALTVLVARSLNTTEAGLYFAFTSLFLVLLGVSEFGSDVGLSRFIPYLYASGRPSDARRIVPIAGAASFLLAVLLGLVLTLGVWSGLGADLLPGDADELFVLVALLIVLPIGTVSSTLVSAMRGYSQMVPVTALALLLRPATQLALSGALVAVGLAAVGPMSLAFAVPFALVSVPAALWYRRVAGRARIGPDQSTSVPAKELAVRYASFTWPRAITRILQILVQRGDVVVVALLATPTDAAIYAVATRAILLGQFFGAALQQILAPQLSGLLTRGADTAARDVVKSTTTLAVLVTWPVFLLCVSMASAVLDAIGGDDYSSGSATLALMGLAMCVASFCGAADTLLLMGGRSRLSLVNYAIAFLVDLALLVVLVPTFGGLGAGVAWAGAIVTRNVLGVVMVRRLYGYWTMARGAVAVALVAVVCFLVSPLLLGSWGMGFGMQVIAIAAGASVGYAAIMWMVGPNLKLGLGRRNLEGTAPNPVPGGPSAGDQREVTP